VKRYRALEPVVYAMSGPGRRFEPGEELEMLEAHAAACPVGTVELVAEEPPSKSEGETKNKPKGK
jgi:hypothetical protein